MKVLILDDETRRAEDWKVKINFILECEIDVFSVDQVADLISKFHQSRFDSRGEKYSEVTEYNEYDLVIVDYDLLGLQMDKPAAWATGAELAYCMRIMSSVGFIVVVNQFGTNSFDLTMRRGISSYADVDVGSMQITMPGLWSTCGFDEFRPWHWPNLLIEAERYPQVCSFVEENLDKPVFKTLGFELEDSESPCFINYDAASYIGGGSGRDVTFRQLATSSAGLRVFNALEKDKAIFDHMPAERLAGVCASILIHWLEKVVLPAHEVISDSPHLGIQIPWVVDNYRELESWKDLCSLSGDAVPALLKNYLFEPGCLFSRPVLWAEKARREIIAPNGFAYGDVPPIQFCEDLSKFELEENCLGFPSDVLAVDKKRWVSEGANESEFVNYEPQSYLLM
ncbi:hypothetical protein ACUYGA_06770 [Metapseudomonas otitidis]|uniref:hypothetical protein n=1 Tax=Metapseudomonas otitidis TaxID=319939 RepID=UPI0040556D06